MLCDNFKYQEINWYGGGQDYPTPHLTSANSNGMQVLGDGADWELFLPYDGDEGTHAWIGYISDTLLKEELILDLGDGNGIFPDSIYIKACCGPLTRFQCWASNDNVNWSLFLDTVPANPDFSSMVFPLSYDVDLTPPTKPEGLTAAYVTANTHNLFWTAATDNRKVTEYEIYQDNNLLGSTEATNYYISELTPATSYEYYIVAKDFAGNVSENSDTIVVITNDVDTENPTAPANLASTNITDNMVEFSWDASTDNLGIIGYIIYLDGSPVGTTEETAFAIPGLDPSTSYDITVKAKDAAGNFSAVSNTENITTLATGTNEMKIGTNFWDMGWGGGSADPFKDGHQLVTGENPWKTEFLNELSIYSTLRFMDWGKTNGSNDSSWQQRTLKTDLNQRKLAFEWMIDLGNKINRNIWICVPHKVVSRDTLGGGSNNYIKKLAIMVKTGVDMMDIDLDQPAFDDLANMTRQELIFEGGMPVCEPLKPHLQLYIEYSNETWNFAPAFTQSHYCVDEGEALNLAPSHDEYYDGRRFHAWAALRVFEEMEAVFGSGTPRLVKIDAYHSGGQQHLNDHLNIYDNPSHNPQGIYPDAFSPAPYFGHGKDGASGTIVADLQTAILNEASEVKNDRAYLDNAGSTRGREFKFIAYEGGQHITTNADQINNDPAMYNLYMQYLDSMASAFDEFCHYAHSGAWSEGGAWGAKDHIGQDIADAHKYRAIVDILGGSGPIAVDTVTPSVPANLSSSSVTQHSITLTWDAATDNDTVDGYQIYQNGFYLGYSNTTSYTVTGLSASTQYIYTLKAKDATGNFSDFSNEYVVSTMSAGAMYSVTFTVTDGAQPIDSAVVVFKAQQKITGSNGETVFMNVLPATGLAYSVTKAGYDTVVSTLDVTDADVNEDIILNVIIPDNIQHASVNNLLVYPNPVSGKLNVAAEQAIQSIEIINIFGKQVLQLNPATKQCQVNMENMQNGLYFINIKTGEATMTVKIIIR